MAKVNFGGLSSVAEELELRKRKQEDEEKEKEGNEVEEEDEEGDEVEDEEKEDPEDEDEEEDPEDDSCKFSEYDDLQELTDDCFPDDATEEYVEYLKQAARTGGFDAPKPPVRGIGGVHPLTPKWSSVWALAEEGAEIAVEHYNEKRAPPDGKLQVVEIDHVTCSAAAGMVFYITVEAENVFSGVRNLYQTKVFWQFDGDYKVMLFREKKNAVD